MNDSPPVPKSSLPTRILAGVFVLCLLYFAVINGTPKRIARLFDGCPENAGVRQVLLHVEEQFNGNMRFKMRFISVFGAVQRLLGKHEIADFFVVKDDAGYLHMGRKGHLDLVARVNPAPETVKDISTFGELGAANGAGLIYLSMPGKVEDGYTPLPKGVFSHEGGNKKRMETALRAADINVLSFRDLWRDYDLERGALYFKTDHHWRIETAFWAHVKLLTHLRDEFGFDFPEFARNTDMGNYHQEKHAAFFSGSIARRAGEHFTSKDDFTLIYPKFDTRFLHTDNAGARTGSFAEALLSPRHMHDTGTYANRYCVYMDRDQGLRTIQNLAGGRYRALIIQNSNGLPFSSFLASSFESLTILDPRYITEEEWKARLSGQTFDVVLYLCDL